MGWRGSSNSPVWTIAPSWSGGWRGGREMRTTGRRRGRHYEKIAVSGDDGTAQVAAQAWEICRISGSAGDGHKTLSARSRARQHLPWCACTTVAEDCIGTNFVHMWTKLRKLAAARTQSC